MIKILIIGGGFAGVTTALELSKKKLTDVHITLVSNKTHLEYYPGLFHIVTGTSPEQMYISLSEIFKNTNVEVVRDTIVSINTKENIACSNDTCTYHYDYCVVAVGSVPCYFGLDKYADKLFTISNIQKTLELRKHLHTTLTECRLRDNNEKACGGHIVVIGAGANGCETAGELALYAKKIAKRYSFEEKYIKVDLIISGDRVVPQFDAKLSTIVEKKLKDLGVNLIYNTRASEEQIKNWLGIGHSEEAKTVVWSVGTKSVDLVKNIDNLELDTKGKVVVDEFLRAKGINNMFILGDNAATKYSGTAQTAIDDAQYVAKVLNEKIQGAHTFVPYVANNMGYVMSIGSGWAVAQVMGVDISGKLAWFVRKIINFAFLASILPLKRAWELFTHEEDEWREFDDVAVKKYIGLNITKLHHNKKIVLFTTLFLLTIFFVYRYFESKNYFVPSKEIEVITTPIPKKIDSTNNVYTAPAAKTIEVLPTIYLKSVSNLTSKYISKTNTTNVVSYNNVQIPKLDFLFDATKWQVVEEGQRIYTESEVDETYKLKNINHSLKYNKQILVLRDSNGGELAINWFQPGYEGSRSPFNSSESKKLGNGMSRIRLYEEYFYFFDKYLIDITKSKQYLDCVNKKAIDYSAIFGPTCDELLGKNANVELYKSTSFSLTDSIEKVFNDTIIYEYNNALKNKPEVDLSITYSGNNVEEADKIIKQLKI
jgi:NADH dehydrogenase FAD-containing subunit